VKFTKFSGAGNDFIVFDAVDAAADDLRPEFVSAICRRGLSVGADGVILVGPSDAADFSMIYWNSDGSRAGMCGNGARCAARFARMTGRAGDEMVFTSDSGRHRAMIVPGGARVWMSAPVSSGHGARSCPPGTPSCGVLSGVPHLVLFRDDLEDGVFEAEAPRLREESGANVDFARVAGDRRLEIRTWERGVEAETLACGTGAVAAAFAASSAGLAGLPCLIAVRSGLQLTVGRDGHGWWLEGEARPVYSGTLLEPS
jgi:diaminopimelate epimerase